MRKWNTILSVLMLLIFMIHGIMGSFMLNGVGSSAGKLLAWIGVGILVVHTVIGFAGSEGFATGLGGTATMVADVGAVIVLAFRTIHKIAMCYGYEVKSAEDKEFVLNILSVSGANDMKEKKEALLALKSDFLQKKIIEEVLMSNLVKKVAKQLGINLTKRKLMQIMPIIGAGIGAAVNASYINDIAWTARRSYQLKWLADNEYIDANNLNNI